MINYLANGLLIAAIVILAATGIPLRRLVGRLPSGTVRNRWYAMAALIAMFLFGYLGYAAVYWGEHSRSLHLIVPSVFFFGACFVFLTATISLQTATDVMRISLLEREIVTDPLTGVFNRRHLDRRLHDEVARARRYALPLSLILLDVDHFKLINDTHGHVAGDQVLIALGRLIGAEIRELDILARYGGEEFVVIAPQTALRGAIDVAERLRIRIESHPFKLSQDDGETREIRVTGSIGVASLGTDIDSGGKLIQAADGSLYRAKHEGRNRVIPGPPSASVSVEQSKRSQASNVSGERT